MCLKSGWLAQLELCIDRVLKNHKLDGVYFDWNVALYCNNPLHVGKTSNGISPDRGLGTLALSPTGHWDIDGLVSLMEWTRERVGRNGMIIVHDTMTPMFVTENFANYVVGMEWGYGWLSRAVPPVDDLPLDGISPERGHAGLSGMAPSIRMRPDACTVSLPLKHCLPGLRHGLPARRRRSFTPSSGLSATSRNTGSKIIGTQR